MTNKEAKVRETQAFFRQGGPKRGDIYLHYKGGLYVVLGRAQHESTLEDMVIYKSLADGFIWCRPLSEWHNHAKAEDGTLPLRYVWNGVKLDLGEL